MERALLSLNQVNKNFGGLRVINDVSFAVTAGSRTALIGPNGAGKTTLFNLISGVYELDNGSIQLDDLDISHIPSHARCRYGLSRSFQNIRLMPHLSTVENVMLGQHSRAGMAGMLFPLGIGRNRWVREAEEALHNAGLDSYRGQIVADLPYGIQKRIEVIRALMAQPKLLLLDEPAAGLNASETDALLELLNRISEEGVTLLVVEHDMNFVSRLCQQVVVLNFGEKIFQGTPQQAQQERAVLEAYLGTDHVA
ncbi:ABC transporter ATP-binding protein [Chromatiales bacterium (ex Bugula neritina AB1)]|nr:ABC transporter ATP-binding protein [Chromatiales bacterium (ex Bugula neritina AB1)]